ncbi:MAG: aromatic aminobenezylarsenical efflux permease ArsG family transporter [Thermoanaerobaculaceae bacterium]
MSDAVMPATVLALWLGVLTSISPCPLATNIAAVGFVGRHAGRPSRVVLAGTAYVLGRALAYAALAAVLVAGLLAIPAVSQALQRHLNQALGPILVVVGMLLSGLVPFGFSSSLGSERLRERAARRGVVGAGLLGVLFALSFCPVSAALYFGSLIPLATAAQSPLLLPSLYGIGTGLPVLAVAVLIAGGSKAVGALVERAASLDLWARRITGGALIAIGIYLTVRHVFLA